MMRAAPSLFVVALAAVAGNAHAGEMRVGASGVLALPQGAFDRDADEAYGLNAYFTFGPRGGPLHARIDAGAEIYGSETRRVAPLPTLNRINVDQVTDNWIGTLTAGPELAARRGRLAPYVHAFGGVSYFTTTTEARLGYGVPLVTATNHEDTTFTWGGEAGLRLAFGRQWAVDVAARYAGHGRVTYLAEGDLRDVPGGVTFTPRRSEPRVLALRVGLSFR
jgi:opacity protein-like surface antigen